MTLRRQTRLNLNDDKFEQLSGDTLNLSGNTIIHGSLVITQDAESGKVLLSDNNGRTLWGYLMAIKKNITQTSHGFQIGDVIGYESNSYSKAIANGTYGGEILGVVTNVVNTNIFELIQSGYVDGFTGLTQGTTYFLSPNTPGLFVNVEPTIDGHLSRAILLADSTTSGWVLPYVGYIVTTGDTATIIVDESLNVNSPNPVANSAVTTVINQILSVIAEPPTYVMPTVSLTAGITQTIEMGSTLTNFIANIIFTQNDAGAAIGYQLNRNGIPLTFNQNNTLTETNITSIITFQGIVNYSEGLTKNNNLGIPDPTGKILAGSISSSRIITPRLRQFWGVATGVPITSTDVRNLSNNNFDTMNNFNLITGTVNRFFVIAIPSIKSLVSVIDSGNLNVNITSQYILINNSFVVMDAGGNNRTYKLYVMETAVPYPSSTTHVITVI